MSSLDVEDITLIRNAIKEEVTELKGQISREIILIVTPLESKVTDHIAHDEVRDKEVGKSLNLLFDGQTALRGDIKTGRVVAGLGWSVFLAVFGVVIANW